MLLVRIMFRQRKKGVVLTDQRIRTITEAGYVLQNFSVTLIDRVCRSCRVFVSSSCTPGKLSMPARSQEFVNENWVQFVNFRKEILRLICSLMNLISFLSRFARATLIGVVSFIPVLASILSFVSHMLTRSVHAMTFCTSRLLTL